MNIINALKTFLLVGFCFSSCIFFSCKDDTSQLGLGLQNPDEKVFVFNDSTMQINSFTVKRMDTFAIQPNSDHTLDYFLLGYLNDPELGEFTNSFLTEIDIISKPTYKTSPVVDSVVLELGYNLSGVNGVYQGVYGSSDDEQVIDIYDIKKDSSIFDLNGKQMSLENVNMYVDRSSKIHQFRFKPNVSDTILKVFLPNEFGERLLDTNFYGSVDTFQRNILRGLYFEAQAIAGHGAIATFDFRRAMAIRLYYRANDNADTLAASYRINTETWRMNFFQRDIAPRIKSVDNQTAPIADDEQDYFYMKNNNAFESILQISGLQNWADSGYYTFNKASLALNPVYNAEQDGELGPIMNMVAYKIENMEYGYFTYSTLNEYYNTSGIAFDTSCNCYNLKLNNTLFNTIESGKDTLSILLTTAGTQNYASPKRTVFYGANNAENPIKLHITYTKFKE